ncbi:MAG: hypothetical protein A2Y62_13245 [Candidatus Fischerbacteria bacterium RBG_13_37_8]|uniref:PPM-type phosphatase domain-containing protein n=1 Tax=Candidatus Fischerbacteria bacterium RBG_13_37_8 TaxID=1817863 RepID=A0A1F5VNA0_9BACT|nr:MAG: hypothetical protein A2Y62_13245 [Candidatus Fischerbacteria bacterium RBG_13_37_8]
MTRNDTSFDQMSRTLRRDIKELYNFYLDEERRRKLDSMKRMRRWFYIIWWTIKSLIQKLSPARRIVLVISLICFILGNTRLHYGNTVFALDLQPLAFMLVFLVLMLELKDKLLFREELEAGRAVQLSLMPKQGPSIPGWEIWLFTRPANDVGGDLVDYLKIIENQWAIILGDVSGKGLAAALLMAKLQATVRALASDKKSLIELGRQLNHILCRDGITARFATMLYMEVNARSGKVRILNAGHIPPVIIDQKQVTYLTPVAMPLGAFPDAKFKEQILELPPDALLVCWSDGLTDACNTAGEFFGEERLKALFSKLQGLTAEQVGMLLRKEVEQFVGEARAHDDFSIVILKRNY